MHDFLEKLAGQELLPADRQAAYTRTHPLTRDRIDAVENHIQNSPWTNAKLPAWYDESFARLKAKLVGFIKPTLALRRYAPEDPGVPARYARAIAYYQQGDLKASLPLIDGLIAQEPNNPFFQELKGQVLMEHQRIPESLGPYRRSVELLPDSGLLRGALAQALLETNDPRYIVAYALAEEALARGDRAMARRQAERAEKMLPVGSPGWVRAQDIRGVVDRH